MTGKKGELERVVIIGIVIAMIFLSLAVFLLFFRNPYLVEDDFASEEDNLPPAVPDEPMLPDLPQIENAGNETALPPLPELVPDSSEPVPLPPLPNLQ